MKFVSQLLQPLLTIPKNAKIKNTEITCKSQKLLLECGLIRPTASGLFALLPLALRAVDKLEALVRHRIEEVGGQRLSLPALTAANLWEKTGRMSEELLKVQDRTGRSFVLAPTHEEAIADLLADVGPLSYKQLPLLVYQISDKFRDELRPKHGVLRARSFRMLDAYGAHASHEHAVTTYHRVTDAYQKLFKDLHLKVYRVAAECGDMGGSESHEWQLPAPAGEDRVPTDGGSVSSVEAALETPPRFELRASGRVQLLTWPELMMALAGHDKVNGKWQFTCQHGADECYGNKLQSCILKDRGLLDTDKMELVICLMTQANPDKSLDTRCAGGDQGDTLLASNGDKTDGVQRPLAFVPTVVVNERFDQAIQDEAVTNLKAVICRLAPTKPAVC
ncbi:hypothetical protein MSG28_014394 [Choristoneura fumiferana]|uniref:Uncharacterized protein n=2 Tax=Choristoneura fumiferana TaxID=7141 RepID=A0ACC0JRA0_CHOFU|nr:hypothetical protein MSG28_014394 [Choristoneura fumiferana]KAI8426681.1 hypothetical protein MSG28_014394 [Choristoneura fumiferana]